MRDSTPPRTSRDSPKATRTSSATRRASLGRRDPFARHLAQAARHERVVRDPPLELRCGVLHRRGDPRPARELARNRRSHRRGFVDVGTRPGSAEAKYIDWLTIADQAESIREDVAPITSHPLVPADIVVHGYLYDVRSGRLIEVPASGSFGEVDGSGGGGCGVGGGQSPTARPARGYSRPPHPAAPCELHPDSPNSLTCLAHRSRLVACPLLSNASFAFA